MTKYTRVLLMVHLLCLPMITGCSSTPLVKKIGNVKGLVALWDFKEKAGEPRYAVGMGNFPLREANGKIERAEDGPLSGFSAVFDDSVYLSLPYSETGLLNINGKSQGVTVIAWVKWKQKTGFVGGMWNEHESGGKRQYGLFVNLPHYNGKDQVCGHISYTGKPTPPFPYSIDYSASKQTLVKDQWHCIAFTYDGTHIKSFLDGEFQAREPEIINHTKGFEGYPQGLTQSKNPYFFPDGMGDNGSDFTVGAVMLSSGMGNFFYGQIGGLAVFDRALTEEEIADLG